MNHGSHQISKAFYCGNMCNEGEDFNQLLLVDIYVVVEHLYTNYLR